MSKLYACEERAAITPNNDTCQRTRCAQLGQCTQPDLANRRGATLIDTTDALQFGGDPPNCAGLCLGGYQ